MKKFILDSLAHLEKPLYLGTHKVEALVVLLHLTFGEGIILLFKSNAEFYLPHFPPTELEVLKRQRPDLRIVEQSHELKKVQ